MSNLLTLRAVAGVYTDADVDARLHRPAPERDSFPGVGVLTTGCGIMADDA